MDEQIETKLKKFYRALLGELEIRDQEISQNAANEVPMDRRYIESMLAAFDLLKR